MKYRFHAPDKNDERIVFAAQKLIEMGYEESVNADFMLYGVNPELKTECRIPCFAGNVSGKNIYDYTKDETFAIENAYLTAEAALSLAISESSGSLIRSHVLIVGYGRIGKALHRFLTPFTKNITVCARSDEARMLAKMSGADTVDFDALSRCDVYDYIFNTVPHPDFNEKELKSVKTDCLLMDLASFPGGADRHFATYLGVNLMIARGLPAKFSPKSAGEVVAKTVDKMIREVIV